MSSVVKLGDPEIAVHPVMITCCKVQLLFTTTVFLLGQSVLHHLDDSSDVNRIATFTCRTHASWRWTIIYLYFMVGLIYARTKVVYQAIKQGDLGTIAGIKIPRQWQVDWQEPASLLLTVILVVMFFLEPIIMCLQHSEGVIFTQTCAEAKDLIPAYEILSMLALLTQFALIIDVAAISTRLSCWVLLAGHVFPEFDRELSLAEGVMTCAAIVFLMLTFSSSISASLENPEDFQDIVISSMSFFKLAVGMYPPSSFLPQDDLLVLAIVSCFRLLVVFFLFKLLIAQLNCEYRRIYRSMMGHARLCRMWKMCQAMLSIHPSRFQLFIERMCFDEPLDFSEGDQGIADPKHPFPMEEEQDISEAARCRRLFELFQKQMKLTLEASVDSRGSADPGQEPGSRVSAFTGSLVSSMAPNLAAQDETAVAPSQSLVSLTRAVRASASSAPQAPVNATVEVGFKKDRHKPPAPPKRKKRPQAELMDVLRGNRSCLLASDKSQAFAELNISNGFLFKAWCLAVELLLAIMAIFVLAAVVVWLSTLDWVKGECLFSDFTNGTAPGCPVPGRYPRGSHCGEHRKLGPRLWFWYALLQLLQQPLQGK
eukprot:g4516.t1